MITRQNWLRVKEHLRYLLEVEQVKPTSARKYQFDLEHLLRWLDDHPLAEAEGIRPTFPAYLAGRPGKDGAPTLSLDTQTDILQASRRFFNWAKMEYGKELRDISQKWISSLRPAPSAIEPIRKHEYVDINEALQLARVQVDPGNLALLRDRAAAALLFMGGPRAAAFTTLPIQAVDLKSLTLCQSPELGVHTKRSKSANTFLYPIPELMQAVEEWDGYVRANLPPTSCWYAVIESRWGEQKLSNDQPGENRAIALNKRLKRLSRLAGLPYRSAHKFRHGHAVYGLLRARTPADFKAISMNLMHENTTITDELYSFLADADVKKRVTGLADDPTAPPRREMEAAVRKFSKEDIGKTLELIEAIAEMIAC